MRFLCGKCRRKTLSIHRWQDLPPVGVCHGCGYTKELTAEEIQMIINRRVCDRPGCGQDIPDGSGKIVRISSYGIGDDIADGTFKEWELCDECDGFYDEFTTDEGRMKKVFAGWKISTSKARAQMEIEEE